MILVESFCLDDIYCVSAEDLQLVCVHGEDFKRRDGGSTGESPPLLPVTLRVCVLLSVTPRALHTPRVCMEVCVCVATLSLSYTHTIHHQRLGGLLKF